MRVISDNRGAATAALGFALALHIGQLVATTLKTLHFARIFAVQNLQRADFDFDKIQQVFNRLFGK
jgi:hypothetical protein